MKKGKLIICVILLAFSLIGCGARQLTQEEIDGVTKSEFSMFIKVENGNVYNIVYHKNTKVMYAISNSGYGSGVFTVLLNADGTPMLYEDK